MLTWQAGTNSREVLSGSFPELVNGSLDIPRFVDMLGSSLDARTYQVFYL